MFYKEARKVGLGFGIIVALLICTKYCPIILASVAAFITFAALITVIGVVMWIVGHLVGSAFGWWPFDKQIDDYNKYHKQGKYADK